MTLRRLSVSAMLGVLLLPTAELAAAPPDVSGLAAQKAMDALSFLTPGMLKELDARMRGAQSGLDDVTNAPVGIPRQRTIYISPMSNGPVNGIDCLSGVPTSVTFVDSTGRPWPLHWQTRTNEYPAENKPKMPEPGNSNTNNQQAPSVYEQEARYTTAVTMGHGFKYDVPSKDDGGNVIVVMPVTPNPRGAMSIKLDKLPAPIPIQLRTMSRDGAHYDAAVVVVIRAPGPNAAQRLSVSQSDDVPVTGSKLIDDILQNTPPAEAEPLDVIGFDPNRIRAWRIGSYNYLRTDADVLNPQPKDQSSGPNVHAFQVPTAPGVPGGSDTVLLSDHGRVVSISLVQRR